MKKVKTDIVCKCCDQLEVIIECRHNIINLRRKQSHSLFRDSYRCVCKHCGFRGPKIHTDSKFSLKFDSPISATADACRCFVESQNTMMRGDAYGLR